MSDRHSWFHRKSQVISVVLTAADTRTALLYGLSGEHQSSFNEEIAEFDRQTTFVAIGNVHSAPQRLLASVGSVAWQEAWCSARRIALITDQASTLE